MESSRDRSLGDSPNPTKRFKWETNGDIRFDNAARSIPVIPLLLTILLSCAEPIEAPEDVAELTLWFYEQWSEDEPAYLEAAITRLLEHADTVDFEAGWSDRSYEVVPLDPISLEGRLEHDRDLADAPGVGVVHQSDFPLDDFLALQAMSDQTPIEPTAPEHYERTFNQGEACFFERTCDVLRTDNNLTRSSVAYDITYDLPKEFRWVRVGDDGRSAICARSWMPQSAHDGEKISLWQGYSADVWVPRNGGTLRYQISWQETEIPGMSWDLIVGVVASGIDDMFETQDEFLAEDETGGE
jgi:hypothetical protein